MRSINVYGEAGTIVEIDGWRFLLAGAELFTNRQGVAVEMSIWDGECAECGVCFRQLAPVGRLPESRRCSEHRRPGVRVGLRAPSE